MIRYSIHLAVVPFPDVDKQKIRPVVVLSEPAGQYRTVLIAPVYSQIPSALLGSDIAVRDNFVAYGLQRPSMIRLHRVTELPLTDLIERLGVVPLADRVKLKRSLRRLLNL